MTHSHPLDGLRLAVELKPINLAVGRAIWNRFGDIRTFAVNIHLKFPFAVVAGVLVIPTKEDPKAAPEEDETGDGDIEAGAPLVTPGVKPAETPSVTSGMKSTTHLIERAVKRLTRAGGRRTEGDAPHLLEAIAVVAYDPETATLDPNLPPKGSPLRWNEFVQALAVAYESRFEL